MHARRLDGPEKEAILQVRRSAQRSRRADIAPASSAQQRAETASSLRAAPAGEAGATIRPAGLTRDEILAYHARTGYSLEHHAAHLIRRAHQRATAAFQEVLAADDLTPTQYAVLAIVLKHDAVSQNLLGA